jgi:hypothetical protein
MAKSKNNVITHGLSGKIGDMLVFSQRAGKTIVGKLPDRSHTQSSSKQQSITKKFQEAVIYAKAAIKDPATKAAYDAVTTEGQSAYNVAIADLFNAPDIESIDLSGYTGKPGETIQIVATDDFMVKEVSVAIYNPDGSLVENGLAVADATHNHFIYTTTAINADLNGDKIVIKASDLPGNLTEKQEIL